MMIVFLHRRLVRRFFFVAVAGVFFVFLAKLWFLPSSANSDLKKDGSFFREISESKSFHEAEALSDDEAGEKRLTKKETPFSEVTNALPAELAKWNVYAKKEILTSAELVEASEETEKMLPTAFSEISKGLDISDSKRNLSDFSKKEYYQDLIFFALSHDVRGAVEMTQQFLRSCPQLIKAEPVLEMRNVLQVDCVQIAISLQKSQSESWKELKSEADDGLLSLLDIAEKYAPLAER
jgi:hypothetical protein